MLNKLRQLPVNGEERWHNSPLCSTMIGECLNTEGRHFTVDYIITNWEASQGYYLIRRTA